MGTTEYRTVHCTFLAINSYRWAREKNKETSISEYSTSAQITDFAIVICKVQKETKKKTKPLRHLEGSSSPTVSIWNHINFCTIHQCVLILNIQRSFQIPQSCTIKKQIIPQSCFLNVESTQYK